MKRILMMVFRNILLLFHTCGLNYVIMPVMWINIQKKNITKCFDILHIVQIKGGNVIIDVHGQENIPKENGFMFFQIIKECMMFWQLLMRVQSHFLLLQRKKLLMYRF